MRDWTTLARLGTAGQLPKVSSARSRPYVISPTHWAEVRRICSLGRDPTQACDEPLAGLDRVVDMRRHSNRTSADADEYFLSRENFRQFLRNRLFSPQSQVVRRTQRLGGRGKSHVPGCLSPLTVESASRLRDLRYAPLQ